MRHLFSRRLAHTLQVLGLLGLLACASAPVHAAASPSAEPARVIVKYKALGRLMRDAEPGVRGPQHAATLAARHGLGLRDGRVIDRQMQVLLADRGVGSAALARRLAADADVEFAVPDQRKRRARVPNDPLYAAQAFTSPAVGQWYLRAPDASAVSAINAERAWDISTGSSRTVVAVLDTGVRFDHPDLAGKLLAGYDFIHDAATSNDGNGRDSDASDPGDWVADGECGADEKAEDSSWHGTQVAGLIGANTGNGVGMASVGWNVTVLPVRVLGRCGGWDSDIIAGMLWAGGLSASPTANSNPARVLNMSLGSSGACSAAYQDAVDRLNAAGVVVVAAAGNEEGLAVSEPANCRGMIAVTGLRHVGTKVGFSNVGPEVAIAAPGGNCVNLGGACLYPLLTTTNSGTTSPASNGYSDSANPSVGTSFSTPLVAGAAALMLSVNPNLSAAEVRTLLQRSARAFPTTSSDPTVLQCHAPNSVVQAECICTTSTCGAGMLDVAGAVSAAAVGVLPQVRIGVSASSVTLGAAVTLDGSGSTAPAGRSIASYQWAVSSGPASFVGATTGASAQLLTSGAGNVTVTLTVTDSSGAVSASSTTITVSAPAAPTVRILASAQVVAAGSTLSFDGSGSTVAQGLSVAAYQWSIVAGGNLATLGAPSNAATASVTTAGSGSGSFTVQLTVTDSLGQQSSDRVVVTVSAVAPTASISASALNVTAGASVGFDGSGSTASAGRTITRYQWALTAGSNLASISGSSSASTATVVTSAAGSFTLQLTVTDSAGASATRSSTVTVTQPTASGGGGSGGGGGGAMSAAWLMGLALATLGLWRQRRASAQAAAAARAAAPGQSRA